MDDYLMSSEYMSGPATRHDLHQTVRASPVSADRPGFDVSAAIAGLDRAPLLTVSRHTEPARTESGADLAVVAAAGQIDIASAPLLRTALLDAVDRHGWVCCDLSDVTLFGADGVNLLMAAHSRAAAAGSRFSVRGIHRAVRRVLEITGVEQILTIDA